MKITKAVFVSSSEKATGGPHTRLPEFAFIGRSNVGKSSLINCLCAQKGLAHTSSTPGKTQCINRFMINDSWYIVDLPGYGYAQMSHKRREKLASIISDYVDNAEDMVLLFVLLDSRHPIQKIDLEFLTSLGEKGVPFSIIYTKSDKSGTNALSARLEENAATLAQYWEPLPDILVTSSQDGRGREEVINYIGTILNNITTH